MEKITISKKKGKFFPSKKLGQNFLINQEIIEKICLFCPNLNKYELVIEIGSGLGAITSWLVKKAKKLISIEFDKRLFDQLKSNFSGYGNLEIINDDFLQIDLFKLCGNAKKVIIVANIPYSITTPIFFKALSCNKIQTMYLMIQKEVAQKLITKKTAEKNAMTNIIDYYFQVKKIFDVSSTNFYPQPKVTSSIVLLSRKNKEEYDKNFFLFIQPFFLFKRKKLLNNLPKKIDKQEFLKILFSFGFNENVRAEELSCYQWKQIYTHFVKK